ncbi:hypothetical protein [Nocardioides jishulii]|uniref:DUF975 family protein n=1 Tax=Nocardioides jishulii TaxID=2575440 RepID=A0A4U2YRD1_9ACTN|nr:hypothetical protein [Nocardioides jishulii]QCX26227.1 hypothetical protein FCL41_00740 [Nocardioides jishulii]TKI63969.1 hypothetical protein FC770_01965 [Nocardioides jishulii]
MSTHGNEPNDPQNPGGQPPYGDQPGQPPYGDQPQQPGQSPYGEPQYGQPSYGEPQYGQQQYGSPYGEPAYGQVPPGGYGYSGGTGGGEFSVGAAFSYAWAKFKANAGALIAITAVGLVLTGVLSSIGSSFSGANTDLNDAADVTAAVGFSGMGTLFSMLASIASMVMQALLIKAGLSITRTGTIGDLFGGINWLHVIIASVVLSVLTTIGLVLCLLPGLAVMFFTFFTLFFIIDRDQNAFEAIGSSFSFVSKNAGTMFVFALACFGVYLLGFIACCVGLLVAFPVAAVAQSYTFRTLQGEPVAP